MRIVVPDHLTNEFLQAGEQQVQTLFQDVYAGVQKGTADAELMSKVTGVGWSQEFAVWAVKESVACSGQASFETAVNRARGYTRPWAPFVFFISLIVLIYVCAASFVSVSIGGPLGVYLGVSLGIASLGFVVWSGLQLKKNRRR